MLKENVVMELSQGAPEWILKKRLEYLKKFNELPMPYFKYGIGIFVDISGLNLDDINPLDAVDDFVVTGKGVEVLSLKDGYEKYGEEIKKYFLSEEPVNKLSALHSAFFNEGLVIKVPEDSDIAEPILINLDMKNKTRIENILVIVGKNSKASIIESTKSNVCEPYFRSQVTQLVLEENSKLEYKSYQNFSKCAYNFSIRKAKVKSNASISWIDCFMGSKMAQVQTISVLENEGATAKNRGIIFGDGNQCYDIDTKTIHLNSNTSSDMLAKVVLDDRARTVYRGLIKINKDAINCCGYQKEETILLSDGAKTDAVPNLEIQNNDVKCSHGATISQIDEDKLFYMMSRGLSQNDARHSIVEGFFEPIVNNMGYEKVQDEIKKAIHQRLKIKDYDGN